MPPRGSSNRNRKGKIPPKKKNNNLQQQALQLDLQSNNPSDTLQAIVNEISLSYDSSLGLLQGDTMFSTPPDYKLLAVKKLLEKLINELDSGIKTDTKLVTKIEVDLKAIIAAEAAEAKSSVKVKKEESIGLDDNSNSKKRSAQLDDSDHDTDTNDNKKSNNESNYENEVDEDDEDDDGIIRLPKKKKRKIIITANGERNEIASDVTDKDKKSNGNNGELKVKIENPFKRMGLKEFEGDDDDNGDDYTGKDGTGNDESGDEDVDDDDDEKIKTKKHYNGDDQYIPSVYAGKENQILPIEDILKPAVDALNLYDEEKAKGTSSTTHEFLQRKYAVEVYPQTDLKDMLPGEIPTIDFSNTKPPGNQIAFTSFQAYVDPFYRNFNDEDLKLLRTKCILSTNLPKDYDDKKTPFQIPKLGPLYSDLWYEEDLRNGAVKDSSSSPNFTAKRQMEINMRNLVEPKGSSDDLTNDLLETDEISCGPLTSRLLAALIKDQPEESSNDAASNNRSTAGSAIDLAGADEESEQPDTSLSSSALADQQGWKSSIVKTDYKSLDERLKRELKYIGVYMNVEQTLKDPNFEQDWMESKDDDEISSELRNLQQELKNVQVRNSKRKKKLIPIVEEQIAWQEYISILEDLDKQVEQHYRRRINVAPKKSKKRGPGAHHHNNNNNKPSEKDDSQQLVSTSSFKSLLEKRAKWITKIGPLFKTQLEMRRMPKDSIFKDMNLHDNMIENDEDQDDADEGDDVDVLGNNSSENGGTVQTETLGEIQ